MTAIPSAIMKQYPLSLKSWRLIIWKGKKGAWMLHTDRGLKVLKKSPANRPRQIFIAQGARYLRRNGAPIPGVVRTRSGADFAEHRGSFYSLTNGVRGRQPDYRSPAELRLIMRTLGRFHAASKGFTAGEGVEGLSHLGRWEVGYQKRLAGLEMFREEAKRRSTRFAKTYLRHADTLIRQGREAVRIIRGDGYRRWVEKVRRDKNLCHQDFASGNLIRTSRDLYVIDLDSMTFDLPARDLRKILNKVLNGQGWTLNLAAAMLRAYHSVHPLTDEEYGVLKADLLFPHLFYGISSKYFDRRVKKQWTAVKTLRQLNDVVQSEHSKMTVLAQWDRVIQRVITYQRRTAT